MGALKDAPPLEGWLTFQEAAEILGLSRQAVHKMADQGEIPSVRKVGPRKPTYVVREAEIRAIREARAEAARQAAAVAEA